MAHSQPLIGVPYRDEDDINEIMEIATLQNLRHCPELAYLGPYRIGTPWGFERLNRVRLLDEIVDADSVDCDDLGPARAAELRLKGEPNARAVAVWLPEMRQWHIMVEREDGSLEDPSIGLHPQADGVMAHMYPSLDGVSLDYMVPGDNRVLTATIEQDGDIGGFWDWAPRLLTATLPVGAKVLETTNPTLYNVAETVYKRRPEIVKAGKTVIGRLARHAAKKVKPSSPTARNLLCKASVADMSPLQQAQHYALCQLRSRS
jgi:hypothetical protein